MDTENTDHVADSSELLDLSAVEPSMTPEDVEGDSNENSLLELEPNRYSSRQYLEAVSLVNIKVCDK